MAILLIRHGETAYNAGRIMQYPDTPLNERGLEQARLLGKRLELFAVGSILASDYARARMTAEAVQAATGAPVQLSDRLRERDFGDLRGKPYDELGVDLFAPDYHPPNGESWPMFRDRVAAAWEEIQAFARGVQGDAAVVSHALLCRALVERHLTLGPGISGEVRRWPNTALTIIENGDRWQVTRLACGEHLDGTSVVGSQSLSGI